jgi:hypothetical protein
MYKHLKLPLMATLCLMASPVFARPVSYPGGISPMTMNNGEVNAFSLMYSPTAKYAVGYGIEYWREDEYTIQAFQLNNLLKRWNNADSQANLYLQSGVGMAYSDKDDFDHKTQAAAFTGLAVDWEDRRFFTSYENRYTEAGDIDNGFMQSARVGVAPYIGEFGDLHTWLMLEVHHMPEANDNVTVTPMVRLFKGTNLVEAGMSNQGDVMFNWMIQF